MKQYAGLAREFSTPVQHRPPWTAWWREGDEGRWRELPPRNDLFNHSPDGFAWGYGGSGPAQLALALLAHVLGDDERAVALHHPFKFRVVAGWDKDRDWAITEEDVRRIADEVEAEVQREAASA